jgi:hypothetical protein
MAPQSFEIARNAPENGIGGGSLNRSRAASEAILASGDKR